MNTIEYFMNLGSILGYRIAFSELIFFIPSGVKMTIALTSMRQARPEGFWYL